MQVIWRKFPGCDSKDTIAVATIKKSTGLSFPIVISREAATLSLALTESK